jgi:hypothetical protein
MFVSKLKIGLQNIGGCNMPQHVRNMPTMLKNPYTDRSRTRNHQSKHLWDLLLVHSYKRDNLMTTEAPVTDYGDARSNPPTAKRAAQLCQALKFYHEYSAFPDIIITQEFGTPLCQRIFSPSCNKRGSFCQQKNTGGARCAYCENLWVRSGKSLLERMKGRPKMFL